MPPEGRPVLRCGPRRDRLEVGREHMADGGAHGLEVQELLRLWRSVAPATASGQAAAGAAETAAAAGRPHRGLGGSRRLEQGAVPQREQEPPRHADGLPKVGGRRQGRPSPGLRPPEAPAAAEVAECGPAPPAPRTAAVGDAERGSEGVPEVGVEVPSGQEPGEKQRAGREGLPGGAARLRQGLRVLPGEGRGHRVMSWLIWGPVTGPRAPGRGWVFSLVHLECGCSPKHS
mmetsp:Transcript_40038/g.111196  ORF Transcript_40038/g.111196 Transcript_40038/m.111196 type:complete len:231 (+) Transcript_40038:1-693(+)